MQSLEFTVTVSAVRGWMGVLKAAEVDDSREHCDLEQCSGVSANIYGPNVMGL